MPACAQSLKTVAIVLTENRLWMCTPFHHLQVKVQVYRSLKFDFARDFGFERFFQVFQYLKKVHVLIRFLHYHLLEHTWRSFYDFINIHVKWLEHIFLRLYQSWNLIFDETWTLPKFLVFYISWKNKSKWWLSFPLIYLTEQIWGNFFD
jgi:hypothetical protein